MTRLGDTSKIKSVNIVMGLMTICFVIGEYEKKSVKS